MDEIHPAIIEVPQQAIEAALEAHGITGFTLYEVPEKAVKQMAGLTEAQNDQFGWQSVWAAIELSEEDAHGRFWDAAGTAAKEAGRFCDFVRAVRQAVMAETEPGRWSIVFRGFQWEYPFEDSDSEPLPAPADAPWSK